MKGLAAQLYTVRDFCKDEAGIDASLKKIADIGYTSVQVSGIADLPVDVMKALCDKYGLSICCMHVSLESLENNLQAEIDKCKLWNCAYTGVGGMPWKPDGSAPDAAAVTAFIERIRPICKALRDNGLWFTYHNHAYEFARLENGKNILEMLDEAFADDELSFLLDTYWIQFGGASIADTLNRFKGKTRILHLKDMGIDGFKQYMAPIGSGNIDMAAVIRQATASGVAWFPVELDTTPGDPFDALADSLKFCSTI